MREIVYDSHMLVHQRWPARVGFQVVKHEPPACFKPPSILKGWRRPAKIIPSISSSVGMCKRTDSPILNPPPSSLPIPSLWVVPVHQPQAYSIVHQTCTGDSFHIWYNTCFNAILPNHPTLSLSHRVQKTVLYFLLIALFICKSLFTLCLPHFIIIASSSSNALAFTMLLRHSSPIIFMVISFCCLSLGTLTSCWLL